MANQKRRDKGGGSHKYDRNKIKCQRYRAENRRAKNKARRAVKLAKKFARRAAKRSHSPT